MGKESTNHRGDSNAKGKTRMRKYEKRQEKDIVKDDGFKITTFWEKLGNDGSWEEKEYRQKIDGDADGN